MRPITSNSQSDAATLAVSDVHFAYHRHQPVLRGVTASLLPGCVTALIGPNAAGKTSLVRLMLGQLSPLRGSVTCGGRDVQTMTASQRASLISYVPQRGGARFAFTVQQVVQMGRYALPDDPGAVDRAMALCGLGRLHERIYAELSVGQQQRVLVARALAQSAGDRSGDRIMLLDEPASAMDPWHVHRTMQILQRQAAVGLAVLVVLHDVNLAARYAEHVWLMADGQLVSQGPWDQVLRADQLEPVYRVRFLPLTAGQGRRPVFFVEPADTLSM